MNALRLQFDSSLTIINLQVQRRDNQHLMQIFESETIWLNLMVFCLGPHKSVYVVTSSTRLMGPVETVANVVRWCTWWRCDMVYLVYVVYVVVFRGSVVKKMLSHADGRGVGGLLLLLLLLLLQLLSSKLSQEDRSGDGDCPATGRTGRPIRNSRHPRVTTS